MNVLIIEWFVTKQKVPTMRCVSHVDEERRAVDVMLELLNDAVNYGGDNFQIISMEQANVPKLENPSLDNVYFQNTVKSFINMLDMITTKQAKSHNEFFKDSNELRASMQNYLDNKL